MEKEVQQQLSQLKQSLEKIKSLHAWKELKQWERDRETPPAFQVFDSVDDDLHMEVSYFVSQAMTLHRRLRHRTETWARIFRNELVCMEREIAAITAQK